MTHFANLTIDSNPSSTDGWGNKSTIYFVIQGGPKVGLQIHNTNRLTIQ